MDPHTRHRAWAAINALGFLATIIMNGLANAVPLNNRTTGELSDAYPNLFVPAGLTFSIWGLIYLLLLAFVGFQLVCAFRGEGERASIDRIGPWFLLSSAANSAWIVAWHWQYVGVALLIMLVILGSLLAMYLRLDVGRAEVTAQQRFLVQLPISVYLGWITVATIANVTTLLVDRGYQDLAPGPVFWTVAVMLVAVVLGAMMIVLRRDRAFAAVVVWALLGILIKRRGIDVPTDDAIELTAMLGMGALVVVGVVQLFLARRSKAAPVH